MSDQPMSQEQVLAQLRTRGYETGGFKSPLRHFRGKLESITGAMVQRGTMAAAKLEVCYNFSDLEVFESASPYPFPVAQITMMHSIRDKSAMGVLGASMDKLVNAGLDSNTPQTQARNQDVLIGLMQEWRITGGHMMWDNDKKEETPRDCWEVVWAEDLGGTPNSGVAPASAGTPAAPNGESASQRALKLLDGKTQAQWNNVVFQDTVVKGDPVLVNSIIQGEFIVTAEEAGLVTKDADGIYHTVVKEG